MIRSYESWLAEIPEFIKNDALWELGVYRKALFLADLAWYDCETLAGHHLGKAIASQLIRSTGSVPANIEEGFGRGFGKDYARFLRIALGSARESRGWYYRGRHLLKETVLDHRQELLKSIIAGLITLSNQQRHY